MEIPDVLFQETKEEYVRRNYPYIKSIRTLEGYYNYKTRAKVPQKKLKEVIKPKVEQVEPKPERKGKFKKTPILEKKERIETIRDIIDKAELSQKPKAMEKIEQIIEKPIPTKVEKIIEKVKKPTKVEDYLKFQELEREELIEPLKQSLISAEPFVEEAFVERPKREYEKLMEDYSFVENLLKNIPKEKAKNMPSKIKQMKPLSKAKVEKVDIPLKQQPILDKNIIKKSRKLKENQRSFTVEGVEGSRYLGTSPLQAATKASRKLNLNPISLRETTKGSKKKVYSYVVEKIEEQKNPRTFINKSGKKVILKKKYILKSLKDV